MFLQLFSFFFNLYKITIFFNLVSLLLLGNQLCDSFFGNFLWVLIEKRNVDFETDSFLVSILICYEARKKQSQKKKKLSSQLNIQLLQENTAL